MTSTVLILGSTGRFGHAAAQAFAAAGWQVLAQRRPRAGRTAAAVPAPRAVRWLDAEPAAAIALAAEAGGAQVVVHAMNPAYTAAAWRTQAPAMLDTAVQAAHQLGALLMFPGNVYNFGAGMPAQLGEDTPQQPTTVKGAIRARLEQALVRAAQTQGVRSVVIRAGDYYGSGEGSLLDRVIAKPLRQGRIGLPGGLDVFTPWAYLPDLARTFVRVAEQGDRLDGAQVLHFAGHVLRGQDWQLALTGVAREAGWLRMDGTLRIARMPWPLIRAGGLLLPEWASLAEMRYLWSTPHALDNTRLRAFLGEEPHTPFPLALRQSLTDLGLLDTAPALRPA